MKCRILALALVVCFVRLLEVSSQSDVASGSGSGSTPLTLTTGGSGDDSASGDGSLSPASGSGSTTSGSGSLSPASGSGSTASGSGSIASGSGSTASGSDSTASGSGSTASGSGSTSSGSDGNTAAGSGSTASGSGSTASGSDGNTAAGSGSTVSGSGSSSITAGSGSTASGSGSTASGSDSSTAAGSGSSITSGSGSSSSIASGSGDDDSTSAPGSASSSNQVTCEFTELSFEVFTTTTELAESLVAQCTYPADSFTSIIIEVDNRTLVSYHHGYFVSYYEGLLIDYLSMGSNPVSILICEGGICDSEPPRYNVSVVIGPSTSRLLPYGSVVNDTSFTGVLDWAQPIYLPQENPIPFFDGFYTRLWVSSNGLVSFGWPYLSWWPVPFPFGFSSTPVIAPYWADFDFRVTNSSSSRIYYQAYTRESEYSSRVRDAIFKSFRQRFSSSSLAVPHGAVSFEPEWIAIITWNNAVPYYWRYRTNERATFQLLLATDYIRTYAFYLYENSTLNLYSWQRVVIGYDRRNFMNYHTVELGSRQRYAQIHNLLGNTGRVGEWLFDFSARLDDYAELRCLAWSRRQRENSIVPSQLPRCPCTIRQAFFDFRYWFGYFWGLSSQPNCATVLFTGTSSTTECCYDWLTGALIVGPNNGGTYKLHNPLFQYYQYRLQDFLPYQDCCVESNRCDLYFRHRPYDDCSLYAPPRFFFMFGDPHFTSIDNANFTFNGIGEYVFVRTPPSLNFQVQGRLAKYESANGTVISAIVVKYSDLPSIQVQANPGGNSEVYVGGVLTEVGSTPVIVGASGMASLDSGTGLSGNSMSMSSSSSMIYVRRDNDSSVVISNDAEASVTVAMQEEFLGISLQFPRSFVNQTSGLLGVFNDNPDDDFQNPKGQVLDIDTSMDRAVYYDFGLLWHLNESESFFNYSISNSSYSTMNDGYQTYVPLFTEDVLSNTSDSILQACNNDPKCVYDYTATGNMEVGLSTLDTAVKNDDIVTQINNQAPNITGDFIMTTTLGTNITHIFKAEDSDEDEIASFNLKDPIPEGFSNTTTGDTMAVTWNPVGVNLPNSPLEIFASDSKGGVTTRIVSVVLCACINSGSCLMPGVDLGRLNFNSNRQYKWECTCPDFFGGDSCEVDMRGCGEFSDCPETSVCTNDSSVPSGYACGQCMVGYEIVEVGGKCTDINECMNSTVCGSHQVCSNTEGSFTCSCESGYRMVSEFTCEDVNECEEGSAECEQTCANTEGGYDCGCLSGFSLLPPDNTSCIIQGSCNHLSICNRIDCIEDTAASSYECLCLSGLMCEGDCLGSQSLLGRNNQRCADCPLNSYGPRCALTCNCGSTGVCNSSVGCQCHEGWTGTNCTIELNEHSPVFAAATPATFSVRWDLNQSSPPVLTITATDADEGPQSSHVTYSLQPALYQLRPGASDGTATFAIGNTTGMLSLNPSVMKLDSLSSVFSEFVLNIQASDGGNPVRSARHTLSIMPLPVPTFDTDSVAIVIDEELPLGTQILFLNCTEIGRPSSTRKLSLTGDGSANFMVSKVSSGYDLVLARTIDYDSTSVKYRAFYLTAICNNSHGLQDSLPIAISVNNIDDNRFAFEQTSYTAEVPENVTNGEPILAVRAFDNDFPNAAITYTADSSLFRFVLGANTLVLVGSLDREMTEEYTFNLTARYTNSSGGVMEANSMVTIEVSDVNDNTPEFGSEFYYFDNITTIARAGDHVLTISAVDSDQDENSEITYDFSTPNQDFYINSTTGDIFVLSILFPRNYEFSVDAIDNGTNVLSASATVTINVNPYPIAVYLTLPETRVEESLPVHSSVGTVEATVIDYSGVIINDTSEVGIRFEIINGSDAERFVIDQDTGEIFTLASLDYDLLATQYSLLVQAVVSNEDDEVASEIAASIAVVNIDDNPPRFIPQFYATVVEQFAAMGTSVLQVQATDPDRLRDIYYSINTTDVPFLINSITGVIVVQDELEQVRDYQFSIVASDRGPVDSVASVFISVTTSTSVVPVFERNFFQFELPENVPLDTHVGAVTAFIRGNLSINSFSHLEYRISDPDTIDFNSTDLPMRNASTILFHLDGISGNISTQRSIDFDLEQIKDPFFYVEIFNTLTGLVYDYTSVEVILLDLNDNAPRFTQSFYISVIDTTYINGSTFVTLSALDRDSSSNGEVTYSIDISEGNVPTGFSLNPTTGAMTVTNTSLIPGDYYIPVVASDSGSPPLSDRAMLYVAVQHHPTTIEFTKSMYIFELAENAPPNTLVGAVRAVESSTLLPLSNATYSFQSPMDCFGIGEYSGEIRVTCTTLDRESVPQYTLIIQGNVRDGVGALSLVQLSLLDINDDIPHFSLSVYSMTIDDRHGTGMPILQVMAEDGDFGINGTILYTLDQSQNDVFQIDNTSGRIFLANSSVELGVYRVSVEARDMGVPVQLASSALVLITVTRAHPQAIRFQSTMMNISENEPSLSVVGQAVVVTDRGTTVNPRDFLNDLTFSIVGGDAMNSFHINEQTGIVTALTTFDREVAPEHVLEILANFTQFSTVYVRDSFPITILDVNERPIMDYSLFGGHIDDTTPTGHVIVNISASDWDAGDNGILDFALSGHPSLVFGVQVIQRQNSQTFGEIFVLNESALIPDVYEFDVFATDRGIPKLTSSLSRVTIIVEHSIPEEIHFTMAEYYFRIPENYGNEITSAMEIGNVSVVPETPALDSLIFVATGETGLRYFTIDQSTGIISKRPLLVLDREIQSVFTLNVTAYLPGKNPPLTAEAMVIVLLEDLNDNAPQFNSVGGVFPRVVLSMNDLNSDNSILNISASDRDIGTNSNITYSINSVTFNDDSLHSDYPFMVNPLTGEVFIPFFNLSAGSYNIRFRATDGGRPTLEDTASVLIVVQQNVPDSIEFSQPNGYVFSLEENVGAGRRVGTISFDNIPQHLQGNVRFSMEDNNLFVISQSSGSTVNRMAIDFEVHMSVAFNVTVTLIDVGRHPPLFLTASTLVTVIIEDVNDNSPYFIDFPSELTQYEERPMPETLFTVVANDSDSGSNADLRFSILNSDLSDIVTIDSITGAIIAAAGLDRENARQGSTHTLIVQVCDRGRPSNCMEGLTSFRLLDINDNAPFLTSGYTYVVQEELVLNSTAFFFQALDPDVGLNGSIVYSFSGASNEYPFILNATTGEVIFHGFVIDFEENPEFNISLTLSDLGTPTREVTYTNISVTVRDRPDNPPQFSEERYHADISPTLNQGDLVTTVNATDPDEPSNTDSLMYAITSIRETGNRGFLPLLHINQNGHIISSSNQEFWPEARFEVAVLVYDQSIFNLSSSTVVVIEVIPNVLEFVSTENFVSVPEDLSVGSLVASLTIQNLSVSSGIIYSIQVSRPSGIDRRFTTNGNGQSSVNVTLFHELDREAYVLWQAEVTAMRTLRTRGVEEARATLSITVEDVNDNLPVFSDSPDSYISVVEGVTSDIYVTQSNATDRDAGLNGTITYLFVNAPFDFPFRIDSETGVVRTSGRVDYETQSSYNMTVLARDNGRPVLESRMTYVVTIINVNDNFPKFAAKAYFGEVYAKAPSNSFVKHVELGVSDLDDASDMEPFSFNIRQQGFNVQNDYQFQVTLSKPYRIQVITMTESADTVPQTLTLIIEASDGGGLTSSVLLYLSIFTTNNLFFFQLDGVDNLNDVLSCTNEITSICHFMETIASITQDVLQTPREITFYNDTSQNSPHRLNSIIVSLYGWYGSLGPRMTRGELESASSIQPVEYIDYDEMLVRTVTRSQRLFVFAFSVSEVVVTEEVVSTTAASEASSEFPIYIVLGSIGGVVLAALILVLLVAVVCVFGKRRSQEKEKGYDRDLGHIRHVHSPTSSFQEVPLHPMGHINQYYDDNDEETIVTNHSLPWFDPRYLASDEENEELTSGGIDRRLRATVDGDAKSVRRHPSNSIDYDTAPQRPHLPYQSGHHNHQIY